MRQKHEVDDGPILLGRERACLLYWQRHVFAHVAIKVLRRAKRIAPGGSLRSSLCAEPEQLRIASGGVRVDVVLLRVLGQRALPHDARSSDSHSVRALRDIRHSSVGTRMSRWASRCAPWPCSRPWHRAACSRRPLPIPRPPQSPSACQPSDAPKARAHAAAMHRSNLLLIRLRVQTELFAIMTDPSIGRSGVCTVSVRKTSDNMSKASRLAQPSYCKSTVNLLRAHATFHSCNLHI